MKSIKRKFAFVFAVLGLSTSLMFVSMPANSCGSGRTACIEDTIYICKVCLAIDCGLFGYRESGSLVLCN